MQSNSSLYRVIALSLAFLMCFTSVGFAIDMHYCQGQLKSIGILGKAKNCHEMAQAMKNCVHHQKMVVQQEGCSKEDRDCCEHKTFYAQSDQDQHLSMTDFKISSSLQQFVVAYVSVFLSKPLWHTAIPDYKHYKPPLIPKDIPVLVQSFLL